MFSISLICVWATIFITTNVFAAESEDAMACVELFKISDTDDECCEDLSGFKDMKDDFAECFENGAEGKECENFKCVLQKANLLKGDKVDEDATAKSFDEVFKKLSIDMSMADKLKEECLGGSYLEYPPLDASCPALQFFVCVHLNLYTECKNWKKTPTCAKMAENAKKCKAAGESK